MAWEKSEKTGDDFMKKVVIGILLFWAAYIVHAIAFQWITREPVDSTLTTAVFGLGGSLELLACGAVQVSKVIGKKKKAAPAKGTYTKEQFEAALTAGLKALGTNNKSTKKEKSA